MGKKYLYSRVMFVSIVLILTYRIPMFETILTIRFRFKEVYFFELLATQHVLFAISGSICCVYAGHVEYNMGTVSLINNFKPEKARHCSTCGWCIKKMDHHCFWINNCVNYDNHEHLIRFLFLSDAANLMIFLYAVARSMAVFIFGHSLRSMKTLVLVGFGTAFLVFFLITATFFSLQMRLVLVSMKG